MELIKRTLTETLRDSGILHKSNKSDIIPKQTYSTGVQLDNVAAAIKVKKDKDMDFSDKISVEIDMSGLSPNLVALLERSKNRKLAVSLVNRVNEGDSGIRIVRKDKNGNRLNPPRMVPMFGDTPVVWESSDDHGFRYLVDSIEQKDAGYTKYLVVSLIKEII